MKKRERKEPKREKKCSVKMEVVGTLTPFCSSLMEACEIPVWAINGRASWVTHISPELFTPVLQVPYPKAPPLATFQSCYLRCRLCLKAFLSPRWRVMLPDCRTVMLCDVVWSTITFAFFAKFGFIEVNVFLVVTYLLFNVLILFQMLY